MELPEKEIRDKKLHCPFGCALSDTDDNGYCHHLFGFTNGTGIGADIEPVTKVRGVTRVVHIKDPKKRPKVQNGDHLVNPEEQQVVNGFTFMAKKWHSSRVYRNVPKPAEAECTEPETCAPKQPEKQDQIADLQRQVDALLALVLTREKKALKKKVIKKKAEPETASV